VKVPVGTAERLQAKLADASPSEFVALKWYTARKGETLLSISRRLGVSRGDLAEANNLSVKSRVRPGQDLIIPRAPSTLLAARTERAAPAQVASRSLASSAEAPESRISEHPHVTAQVYRVKRGDTLFSIAQLFDTTVAKIKSWNGLRGNIISPGTRLKIFASRAR